MLGVVAEPEPLGIAVGSRADACPAAALVMLGVAAVPEPVGAAVGS